MSEGHNQKHGWHPEPQCWGVLFTFYCTREQDLDLSDHQSTRFSGRLVLGTQHLLDNRLFVVVVIDALIPYLAVNGNIPDKQGTNKLLKMEGPGGGDGTVCFLYLFSEM